MAASRTISGTFESRPKLLASALALRDLRIHDLRHMATTILFPEGVPEAINRKLTGHRRRELERYEPLSPVLKRQTVTRIANVLKASDTPNSEETD